MQSWDDVRVFLAVARNGSVSAAAELLKVNQSTVSRRIHAFEQHLNVRLFERYSTGHELTAEGEELLTHAQIIEQEYQSIERKLRGKNIDVSGPIRVTTSLVFYRYILAPILKEFYDCHPQIELHLDLSNSLHNLTQRHADIAIRITREQPPENVIGRELEMADLAVFTSEAYIRNFKQGQPLAWIGENDLDSRPTWLSGRWRDLKLVTRCNDVMGTVEAIKSGLGIGRLPVFIGEAESDLIRFENGVILPSVPIWLLSHPDLHHI
ncbi:MAG: LysR family transcriptional regulator, partial [Gammaproteobacteria bacterium]|nr:LysR family transcriptional regulator [Gammaproteobacteria bacterium]